MKWIKRIFLIVVLGGLIIFIFFWATRPLKAPSWTGFAPYDEKLLAPKTKTLWDWLELLIIPSAIALGVSSLNYAEKKKDREIEEDRQCQTAMDSYFDEMSKLLLEGKLRTSEPSDEVRCLARTRTLALLRRLDGGRKAQALQFLCEAGLIYKNPIVRLVGANLRGANLASANLTGAEIRGAFLCKANLKGATVRKAILIGCDFRGADMTNADFSDTDLTVSKFAGVKLKKVILSRAVLKWIK